MKAFLQKKNADSSANHNVLHEINHFTIQGSKCIFLSLATGILYRISQTLSIAKSAGFRPRKAAEKPVLAQRFEYVGEQAYAHEVNHFTKKGRWM